MAKLLFYLLIIAGIAYFFWHSKITPSGTTAVSHSADPIAEMERIAATFPRKVSQNKGPTLDIIDVSYDVRKTESMVNPIVGYLNFTEGHIVTGPEWLGSFQAPVTMEMQIIFHWVNDKWVFSRYINRENGKDFTDLPGGLEFLDSSDVGAFLQRHGRAFSAPIANNQEPTPPKPTAKSTPLPTPTPVQYRYFLSEPVTISIEHGSVTLPAQAEVFLVSEGDGISIVRAMGKRIEIQSSKVKRVEKK